MRNLLVALLLLAVVAVVPEHAAPKPEPAEAFVGEFYDVTEIIYSGLVEPRSRLRLDSGVMNDSGVIVYPDDPVFHSDSTAGAAGEDTDRLEALFWNVGGPLIPKNKDMGISFIRFGERLMAHIVAPAAAHDRIRDVLDLLITSLRARVRVVVYEDGRLFGTASGLIGEQLSVARIANSPIMWNNERMPGPRDNTFVEDVHNGREVNLWAVKLANGRLRAHGQITECVFKRARPVMTTSGGVSMPELESRYQPFVADVADPGVIQVAANGRKYELQLSCGASFANTVTVLGAGKERVTFNLLGTLRRHLTGDDPFYRYLWYDMSDPYEWNSWGRYGQACGDQVFTQLEDAGLLELPGAEFDQHGLMVVATFDENSLPPAQRADARKAWEQRKLDIANFRADPPGVFRFRMWEVAEDEVVPDKLPTGRPHVDSQLSLFEGQQADWHDVSVLGYIGEYGSSFHVWLPDNIREFIAVGDYCGLDWSNGEIKAIIQHRTLDAPLDQYDTLERDPLPMIIERPTTTLRQMRWAVRLKPGEHAVTITPGPVGKVLIADLERK